MEPLRLDGVDAPVQEFDALTHLHHFDGLQFHVIVDHASVDPARVPTSARLTRTRSRKPCQSPPMKAKQRRQMYGGAERHRYPGGTATPCDVAAIPLRLSRC